MKKSIVFKPYDGMAAKVGDVVYSAYIPEGANPAERESLDDGDDELP